jgi:hypothetical protein
LGIDILIRLRDLFSVMPRPRLEIRFSETSPESERLCAVLKATILGLGFSCLKVERAMGVCDSYLSRVFSGAIALRVSHVVEIARVLKVEPAEVFAAAFRHMPAAHSPAYERLRAVLQVPRPPEEPVPEPAGPKLEEMLEMLLLKALRRIIDRAEGFHPP